ncbi:MAG: class II glutamine amidotransferase [Xanthomonadales bacterium]|nr:class II glutamine amidotransferase [Xanthomonadales bacterium]
MCRFVYYLGPETTLSSLLTEPEHSLINQSFHARERAEPLNGDGFGIGWYKPRVREEPVLFKEVNPAWNSINLRSLAPVAHSHCIMAHVRAASPGLAVTQLNCHPFARGQLGFMHNGEVAGFYRIRRRLLTGLSDEQFALIQSSGDSEVVFSMAVDHLQSEPAAHDAGAMARALVNAITDVETAASEADSDEPSFLNLVLTDGRQAAITRYVTPGGYTAQSLYVHQEGSRFLAGGHLSQPGSESENAIIVSSEPLSDESGWSPVPENHVLLVHSDRTVDTRPIVAVRELH